MILVDTSVWIDHLRATEPQLVELLTANRVLMHPFVIGELACGTIQNRQEILWLFENLPRAQVADYQETLVFIERHALMGCGIGYTDVHLLAATALEGAVRLWTRDRQLARAAESLDLLHT